MAAAFQGIGNTFQWPAYSAAITMMVPKEQLGRANGMMSLDRGRAGGRGAGAGRHAAALIGLTGILGLDVVTFFVAILALAIVFIPQPAAHGGRPGR